LVEIDAVKASSDENEIGNMIPNVKSLPAYNESKVSQTAVANGILRKLPPRGGRIFRTSVCCSIKCLELEDCRKKENDGIHVNFPSNFKKGRRAENGVIEINKDYNEQLQELKPFVKSMHII
jgi:hypothetical protein